MTAASSLLWRASGQQGDTHAEMPHMTTNADHRKDEDNESNFATQSHSKAV